MASDTSEASLGWRLLATLEGGALTLAVAAVLASAARSTLVRRAKAEPAPRNVIISNRSSLGLDIKRRLESRGCAVCIAASGATSGAGNHAKEILTADALVIIGAETDSRGLDAMSTLVTEDINCNIESLQSLAKYVRPGGKLVWVSRAAAATSGAFSGAKQALDNVLKAQLELVANTLQCKAVFVSACATSDNATAERTLAALLPRVNTPLQYSRFSLRNAMAKIGEYFEKGLKIIS